MGRGKAKKAKAKAKGKDPLDAQIKKNVNIIMGHMAKQVPMHMRPMSNAQQQKAMK